MEHQLGKSEQHSNKIHYRYGARYSPTKFKSSVNMVIQMYEMKNAVYQKMSSTPEWV